MTTESSNAEQGINELEVRQDPEIAAVRTKEEEIPVNEGSASKASPATLQTRSEQRRLRRRRDITNLDGLIREHGRLIAMIQLDKISLSKGEVLSRAYGRHREMVSALEQRQQLAAIQEQLQQLAAQRGDSALISLSPASAPLQEPM